MGAYQIIGGRPLEGAVQIHGAKNSVLPILAATLVCGGQYTINNCPEISDVDTALDILRGIGKRQKGLSPVPAIPFAILGAVWIYQLVWASRFRPVLESRPARMAAVAIVLLAILLLGSGANTQFIYQQF